MKDTKGLTPLGIKTNDTWHIDPKRLLFSLARYKFVAKMLSGKNKVLEVGCGDAFCTRIVLQEVKALCAIDFDPIFIGDIQERMEDKWGFETKVHDILLGPLEKKFDAVYSLDVLEHIPEEKEDLYMKNICRSIIESGVFIIGTPSFNSQVYASQNSKIGHINCKDGDGLRRLMGRYFHNIFIFSMNDEVVHTGFYPMAQYLFGMGVGNKIGGG